MLYIFDSIFIIAFIASDIYFYKFIIIDIVLVWSE